MTTPSNENPESTDNALTIDELAAATRTPSRTIRFYQSRGALMAPEIRGRTAYYGKSHVDRLKLIAQLQDRGLRIDAIRDLVRNIEKGELDLAEWLGVEAAVQAPWVSDQPRTLTEDELYELAGTRRPGLVAELIRGKIVERKGDVYLLASPALLGMAMRLESAGIDLESADGASGILRKHLGRAVNDLVEFFVARAKDGYLDVSEPEKLFEAFRSAGIDAVRVLFAREMEKSLRKLVSTGKLASLARANKKKRK